MNEERHEKRRAYMAQMSEDARVLRYARMLPMDGALTEEHREDVRKLLSQYMFRMDLSNSKVAKKIGVSASVISQFLNGTYKGDVDQLTRKINQWIERDARSRNVRIELPYVRTAVAEDMRSTATLAYDHQCMAAIVAPAGSGKTKVLEVLAESMQGWYLYCDEDLTPRTFMSELARLVGAPRMPRRHGSIAETKRNIIDKVQGTGRPLFLDEAHLLRRDVFARIRSIHDQAQIPIIMAGTHEILTRIDDRAGSRGQMHSRTIKCNVMEHVYDTESPTGGGQSARPLFSKDEVQQLFAEVPVKFDPSAFEMLWSIACLPGYGCLRTVKRLIDLVYRRWGDQTVGRDELQAALDQFFGDQGAHIHQLARQHSSQCQAEAA